MQPIPVNLITGFLGVGKTTAMRHLLAHHPADQKWAVLVNEFGEVGVDGALLAEPGVVIQEVAGGCLCCVAAPAFTTGLNRIIRQHRPDRILIEPSGLGHPAQVLDTLAGPLYHGVLQLGATVCLMDARHLSSPRHREHPNFQDQIHLADVLVANKRDLYTVQDLAAFEAFAATLTPAKRRVACVEQGMIDTHWLDLGRSEDRRAAFPEAHAFLVGQPDGGQAAPALSGQDWLLIEGAGDGYRRAGWIMRQVRSSRATDIAACLAGWGAERTKGVFLTDTGWQALNQVDWRPVQAPADGLSRLELIDPRPIDTAGLDRHLRDMFGYPSTD